MAKLTLSDPTNLINSSAIAILAANHRAIEAALENTLSRDGSTPNSMSADLDMDSNRIINLVAATATTEPVRKAEFDAAVFTIIHSDSTTSNTIGTGAKTFTVDTGLAFAAGMYVQAIDAADSANYMIGQVTSYSGSTLIIDVTTTGGSGTKTDWDIYLSGPAGQTGPTGPDGPSVSDGDKGDITVSLSGATWTIDNGVVTLAKMADMATDSFLGRDTAGVGAPEVLSVATVKTLLGLTGTNSGDQTITLTGDVTGSGTGSFATTIAAGTVTLAKMADMATDSFLGRDTAGVGAPEVLSVATVKTLLGISGSNTGDQTITLTGDVTGSGTGSFAATIAAGAVSLSKMASMATASFLGRESVGVGAPEVLSLATVKTMLDLTGTNSGDQTITLTGDVTGSGTGSFAATIANDAVTYAKLQNVSATNRFLGRITAAAGDAEELTGTQATTLLDVFTDLLKGVVPASGGGTTNYLRADGTWAAPPGGAGGTPGGSDTQVQFNDATAFGGDAGFTYNKTTDFATLAGGLIGPVIAGGTGAASTLTLESTTGVGTTDYIAFLTASQSERLRIDSSGHVIVGGGATETTFAAGFSPALQVLGTGIADSIIAVARYGNGANQSRIIMGKSRGASKLAQGLLSADDIIGEFIFEGSDGATMREAAKIRGEVDGTAGLNDMPGRLLFYTTADGAGTGSERLRIGSNGNITYGTFATAQYLWDTTRVSLMLGGAGQTSALGTWDGGGSYHRLQVVGSDYQTALAVGRFGGTPKIFFGRSASATIGTHTIVAADNVVGEIHFQGSNGTNFVDAAVIKGTIDGTPGITSDMPGRLEFHTVPDGSGTAAERLRIDNAGVAVIQGSTAIAAQATYDGTTPKLQVHSTGIDGFSLTRWSSGANGPKVWLAHSAGGIGTYTTLASGDMIGEVVFAYPGSGGSDFNIAASIRALVEGTSAGVGDSPGILSFLTQVAGGSYSERLRIDSVGNVVINAGGGALATTATAGFIYSSSMAGTPSGTPTSYTGRVPLTVDTTNSKLYGYFGGAWVNLSATGSGILNVVEDTTPQLGGDLDLNGFSITGPGNTVTASDPILSLTQTWNNGAVTFTALKLNVTKTAAADNSPLMDLQQGGATAFATGLSAGAPSIWLGVTPGGTNYAVQNYSNSLWLNAASGGGGVYLALGNSTVVLGAVSTGIKGMSTGYYAWCSTADASGTVDTGLSRNAAAIVEVNTGTAGVYSKIRSSNHIDGIRFYPQDNEPPTTNYATLDTRNGHPVLDFDDTTAEAAIFTGVFLPYYSSAARGITVQVAYSCTSATTGTVGFTVEIERIGDSQLDIDADSFATAQTITAVTVPATSGHVDVVSVDITDGANMDSLAAGEQFRIRIKRDVTNDTATGDAELHWVQIKEK